MDTQSGDWSEKTRCFVNDKHKKGVTSPSPILNRRWGYPKCGILRYRISKQGEKQPDMTKNIIGTTGATGPTGTTGPTGPIGPISFTGTISYGKLILSSTGSPGMNLSSVGKLMVKFWIHHLWGGEYSVTSDNTVVTTTGRWNYHFQTFWQARSATVFLRKV